MNLGKLMKKMSTSHYIFLFLVVAFVFLLYNYDSAKSMFSEKYSGNHALKPATVDNSDELNDYDLNGNYTAVQNVSNDSVPNNVPSIDPSELLPKDTNSQWAQLNPTGSGDLQNVNLLRSGYHMGIDTIGNSLRNANQQLRSEPANPQLNVGPWNNTTISPDTMRVPLEIGQGGQ